MPAGANPDWFTQPIRTLPLQIGFVFSFHEDKWNQSFEKLRLFAEANGGVAHVPQGDPEQPELGEWCVTQVRRSSSVELLTEHGKTHDV